MTQTVIGFDTGKDTVKEAPKKPEPSKPTSGTKTGTGTKKPGNTRPKPNRFWGLFDKIQEEILGDGEKM